MLTIILTCLFAISTVNAAENATNDVVTLNDVTDEGVSIENINPVIKQTKNDELISAADDGTFTALQDRIDNVTSGSTITFENDYKYDEGFSTDGIIIVNDLTIDGNGHTIDGQQKSRIFNVQSNNVIIKNLTIKNANYTLFGGAFYFNNGGTVINCIFVDNSAYSGGAVYFDRNGEVINCNFTDNAAHSGHGGAINIYWGNVENCNFTDNSAGYGGGAVYFDGGGTVTNCNFVDNKATRNESRGGAVHFFDKGNVTNCNFTDNTVTGDISHGGAVFFFNGGDVINCNFTDNFASYGGSVYVSRDGDVTNCNFVNNTASVDGGAVYFSQGGNVTNCNFVDNAATSCGGAMFEGSAVNCTFISNKANTGGAMYEGYAMNCSFLGNGADGDGGATFNAWIINSLFEYNSARNGGAVSGKKAINCTFIKNSAYFGGAVYNAKVSTNSRFSDNNASNGKDTYNVIWIDIISNKFYDLSLLINNNSSTEIYLDRNYNYDFSVDFDYIGGVVINRAVTIYGNGFTIDGENEASIFSVCNDNVVFKDIVFVNGISKQNGGAINGYSSTAINCSFINNSAAYGGAMYYGSAVNCTFTNNYASIWGGAMGGGSAVNCTFTNNSAGLNGGAMEGGSAVNCTFISNKANTGGAMEGGSAVNCTFISNEARDGGAMGGGSAVNCTFTNNSAGLNGGAIGGGSAVNCTFTNNSAGLNGGAVFNGLVANSLFEYNSAINGGAVSGKKVTNSTFIKNSAYFGGAVYNAKVSTNSRFSDNNASYGKDTYNVTWIEIYHSFNHLNLLINNNTSSEIYLDCNYTYDFSVDSDYINGVVINRAVTIYGNGFTLDGNNEARIFSVCNDNVVFKDIVFVNGFTDGYGGGIYGKSVAVNCTFLNNFAMYGGAMFEGSAMNCTFASNSALDYSYIYGSGSGGAMYKGSAVNCTFISNYAINGGAIYNGSAVNCSFVKNSAIINPAETNYNQGRGGAMYYGRAVNCNFTGNSALYGKHIYECSFVNCTFGNTVIFSSNVTKYYGGYQKGYISLNDDNGPLQYYDVEITINGETFSAKTDFDGVIHVDLNLPVGEYNLTAVYENISTTSKINVKSTVATDDVSGTYLNSKVNASFLDTEGFSLIDKQVSFKVGNKTFTATTDAKGVATANIDLDVGDYTVSTVNPINNEEKQFKLVIDKANSAIILSSTQNKEVTTLTATLAPANVEGNVVFSINGEDKTVAVKRGKAILTLSDLDPGTYAVIASYNGNNNLNASSSNTVIFNVAAVYPILTANSVTKIYGSSNKLSINLTDSIGNKIANVDVKVAIGSKVRTIKTNNDGKATMDITNAPGTYLATITYADAKTTVKVTVKKATPKLTAKAKTFKKSVKTKKYTVTLKTNKNKIMNKKLITLKVNKKTYKVKTNSKGQVTFKITNLKKKGKFTAIVKYAGDKYYNSVTVKLKITIK